jgi:hypothetical protein
MSLSNIDPFFFHFVYNGPLITVNQDLDIFGESGTYTQMIPVSISEIACLDFQVVPQHELFSFYPQKIQYRVGDLQQFFRIRIPKEVASGEYKITFQILGDNDTYYSSIKASKLIVSRNGSIPLFMDTSVDVPLDGNSLEIKVLSVHKLTVDNI